MGERARLGSNERAWLAGQTTWHQSDLTSQWLSLSQQTSPDHPINAGSAGRRHIRRRPSFYTVLLVCGFAIFFFFLPFFYHHTQTPQSVERKASFYFQKQRISPYPPIIRIHRDRTLWADFVDGCHYVIYSPEPLAEPHLFDSPSDDLEATLELEKTIIGVREGSTLASKSRLSCSQNRRVSLSLYP